MPFHISPHGRAFSRVPVSRPPSVESTPLDNPEAQFATLDGRNIIALGRRWRIEVYSIHELEWCRYVQLSLRGEPSYMVTVQLTGAHGVGDLVGALVRWLAHPSSNGALIRVG